jgi:hypothetical protein
MAYSRYIGSGAASGTGGHTHAVSNPGNGNFDWLSTDHIKIYLSDAGQSVSSFQSEISAGTVSLFNPADGYTLVGTTLTFSGLSASATYRFLIKRETPKLSHFVNFQAGAPLTELALDNSNKYTLFRAQELEDDLEEKALSLANMKTTAGITGDFVDTTSAQTITNKTFQDSASTFDGGTLSFNG